MQKEEANDSVMTVSQLTGLIKTMLEGTFSSVLLKGEISNYRPNASGHMYFVLKDSESQISAVMFRGNAASLNFVPKDGTLVQVRGEISVYPPRGNYQIIIRSMTKAGAGDIMEMIEERKKRLAAQGYFDSSRKRPLPPYPKTIGIVTSPTGAALRDILQITKRRNPSMNAIVLPALVQGSDAASSIVRMIKIANTYCLCDLLIVGRGGGSLEDLLPFSDEDLVKAIATSKIPIISAVGHEIDWALSDYAADKRAPTPSAAAEIAVPLKSDIEESIASIKKDLNQQIRQRLDRFRIMLKTFTRENMELHFRHIEQPLLQRLDMAKDSLNEGIKNLIQDKKNLIKTYRQTLENCNPQTIFNRGYSMVTDEKGNVIRSSANLKIGQSIKIRPAQGLITSQITEIQEADV